jgi:hypothetical protein
MEFLKFYPKYISNQMCEDIIKFYLDYEIDNVDKTKSNNITVMNDFWVKNSKNNFFWENKIVEIRKKAEECIKDYLSFSQFCNLKHYDYFDANIMHHIKNYNISPHYDSEIVNIEGSEFLRHFVILLYLNDDFEGGELILPIQNITIKPSKGSFVFLPSSFMYPHIIAPALGKDRFVLRLNYYFNKKYLDLDVYDNKKF